MLERELKTLGTHIEIVAFPDDSILPEVLSSLERIGVISNRCAAYIPSLEEYRKFSRGARWLGRPIANGEVGCALAHLNIYKRFLETDALVCVVVEADVSVHSRPDFERLGRHLLADDPRVVILGQVGEGTRGTTVIERITKLALPPTGTFAYALNRHAAELVVHGNQDLGWLADWPPALAAASFSRLEPSWFIHPVSSEITSIPGREELYVESAILRVLKRALSACVGSKNLNHLQRRLRVTLFRDALTLLESRLNKAR